METMEMTQADETAIADGPHMSNAAAARKFILGGKAIFTLQSQRTGKRFTYRVKQGKPSERYPNPAYFVGVLTGPENTTDYSDLGMIFNESTFKMKRDGSISADAPSAVAFDWAWKALQGAEMPAMLNMFHMGRCCKCGLPLTDPVSIESGMGPTCRGR